MVTEATIEEQFRGKSLATVSSFRLGTFASCDTCWAVRYVLHVQPLLTERDDKQAHDQNGPPLDACTCWHTKFGARGHTHTFTGRSFEPLAGLFVHRVVRGATEVILCVRRSTFFGKQWIIRSGKPFCHATFFMYPHLALWSIRIRNSSNVSQGLPTSAVLTPCGSTDIAARVPRPGTSIHRLDSSPTKLATCGSGAEGDVSR